MKRKILLSGAFMLLTIWLGYFIERADFLSLMSAYGVFFLLYWLVAIQFKTQDINFFVGLGIILRIILLFSIPNLSDDFYRFVWDGRLIVNGLNPFNYLPNYYIDNNILPESFTPELYNHLNSQPYFTIYPPLAQAVFTVACWLFPNSISGAVIIMKSILLLGEIGSIYLIINILNKFELPKVNVLLYALNPLLIFEIVGNLHFEGLMIFFLLLSFWLTSPLFPPKEGKFRFSLIGGVFAMAGAIAAKLLPLMFLPFIMIKFSIKKNIIYFAILGIALLLLFAPLLNSFFFNHFGESLNLYFRQFEFNASFYYLFRWIGYEMKGYNIINRLGPQLALLVFIIIITLAIIRRKKDWQALPESWLFAMSIYLLFATTVHPWYITLPATLSIFTKWRYPILWSGAAWLSYSHYWNGNFAENYLLIAIEYLVIITFFIWEVWKRAHRRMVH